MLSLIQELQGVPHRQESQVCDYDEEKGPEESKERRSKGSLQVAEGVLHQQYGTH